MFIFDFFTILLSTIFFIYSIRNKRISGGRYIVYLLFFTFYVLPIFLDVFYEMPKYGVTHFGFLVSSNNITTRIIYDAVVVFIQLILIIWKNNQNRNSKMRLFYITKRQYIVITIGMILPIIAFLAFGLNKSLLFTPLWRELQFYGIETNYDYVERLSYLGIACCCILLLRKDFPLLSYYRLFPAAFLYMNICVQGKRAVLFFSIIVIILIIFFLLNREVGAIKNKIRYYVMGSVVAVVLIVYMITFALNVKINNRGYDEKDTATLFTTTRIDFLRDDRVRLAIFSEFNEDEWPMLNYYGETIIYDVMSIPPIDIVFNYLKIDRYSYQQFLTSCLMHSPFSPDNNYMTPTIFAELISNFGVLFGVLLMAWGCLFFGNQIDKYPYPFNILIICSFVLLNLFAVRYVVFFIEFTIVACYLYKHNIVRK